MRKIYNIFKIHFKDDFDKGLYFSVLVFLTVAISFNYYLDFEDSYLDKLYKNPIHLPVLVLFYGFAYYGVAYIQSLFGRKIPFMSSKFWILSLCGLTILSFDISFYFHRIIISDLPIEIQFMTSRIVKNLISIFTVVCPLMIIYFQSRENSKFYGMTLSGFDKKPYLVMLGGMLILIILGLFFTNLDTYYPLYKSTQIHTYLNLPEWFFVLCYELAYGFDFITIELLFRGFMIIGLTKTLGKEAILPMTATYCFIHFGKPAAETISSVFGGYILGVIAFYTRSIFGGVIIHVGIALGMELLAYLKKNIVNF